VTIDGTGFYASTGRGNRFAGTRLIDGNLYLSNSVFWSATNGITTNGWPINVGFPGAQSYLNGSSVVLSNQQIIGFRRYGGIFPNTTADLLGWAQALHQALSATYGGHGMIT
jgi:hypothetical protein